MLRVKDVPPDQMAEVVRVAGELYDKEQAETQERRATVAAAAEMACPKRTWTAPPPSSTPARWSK